VGTGKNEVEVGDETIWNNDWNGDWNTGWSRGGDMRLTTRFGVFGAMSLQLALMATAALAQQGVVKVGTAAAGVGAKASGVIEVAAGVDAGTSIPVVVVHGAKPGPTLALVTGAHGTEYVSIIAVEKLIGLLDPAEVSGTVILLPLVNIASFEQKVPHVNPVDNKSMNRFYPGKADGTQTERALYAITKEVVDRCDYLIDYHGGDLDESLRPYAYWGPTGKAEQDRVSKEMVLAFGLDHIIIWKERPTDPAATRYLDNTASVRGKASIVVEAGHAGTVETDDVALLVNGTLNTMRALKMLPGEAKRVENPVWIVKLDDLIAEQAGIFYPLVKRGTYVSAGMKIGYATDYVGKVIQEFRAPEAGVVLHINAVPSMKKGDNILDLGVVGMAP
jgi:predicted deacylase